MNAPPSPFPGPRGRGLCRRLVVLLLAASPAQAQTDPSGHWRTWHTPHFRVHAQVANEPLALKAALEAERAYALLSQELKPPRGTIDLTLYDNVDFSNGFTTVFPSSRIAVYLNPPAGDPQLAPYDDWLRLVITHELTHAFHLDRTRGIWRVAQAIFGRAPGSFPNSYQPSWVTEGLAEYYESRLTTGGRLRGGVQGQLLAASAEQHWPKPGDATLLSPKWPDGLLPYTWGSQFFDLENRTGGDSVVPRFIERTAKQWWHFGVSPAARRAGGVGVDSAWTALKAHWDSVTRLGSRGSIVARGSRAEPRPQLSPDGKRLAYVEATGREDPHVVLREVPTGRALAAHRVNAGVDLAWVSDTLYLAQLDFTTPVNVRSALYRRLPGGAWGRVDGSERLGRPFAGGRNGLMAVDLGNASRSVVTLGAQGVRGPVETPAADAWGYVAASPNGEWLAGARHRDGQWDVAAWPAGRPADAVAITSDGALDDDVAWSPAGDMVLFTSERSGLPQILGFKMNTRELVQLTQEPTGARQPALAPDGTLFYATILWDGWAVVCAQPAALAAAPPRPRPQLGRDTITTTSIRASGYSPWPSLLPHFWIPTWHDVGTAGRFGGAALGGVDAIGRSAYFLQLALSPTNGRLEGQFAVAHQRWKAFELELSLTQTWDSLWSRLVRVQRDTVTDTLRVTFGDQKQTASVGGAVSWRRWRSAVSASLAGEWEHERLVIDRSPVALRLSKPDFYFAGPVASVAAQRVSFPALAISPENGVAVGALYRYRWEVGGSGWWSEVRGGANGYLALPLPGFAHWVIAARAVAGLRGGPSADGYNLGGASGDPYAIFTGYALGPGRRLFPLRGYPAVSTGYTRAAASAVELRVPLLLLGKAVGKLPLGFDRVSLTGFFEAGGGWAPGQPAAPFGLRDFGGELVIDGGIPQDARLRARIGVGVPLVTWRIGTTVLALAGWPRAYVAFGTAF